VCCFSRPVPFVGQTRIFARACDDGRQALAYDMSVDVPEELAMVLPLPVAPGGNVSFVDLSGYGAFFDELAKAFPPSYGGPQPLSRGLAMGGVPKLAVIDVGDFEASFVPTARDFEGLDERFRLPPGFFESLPIYADFGFAVFRLKPRGKLLGGSKRQRPHPMALLFPRRDPRALFFPTVHVHDGSVPRAAEFDHTLYAQPTPLLAALMRWVGAYGPLGSFVDATRTRGLVDASRAAFMLPLHGTLPNEDQHLREPDGVTLADLEGRGPLFAYSVRAAFAYHPLSPHAMAPAWRTTARTRLSALCHGMRDGLPALTEKLRARFALIAPTTDLPAHFMNGRQLWSGTDFMMGQPRRGGGGTGRIRFEPFTPRCEPQVVELGFRDLPDEAGALAIQAELEAWLDRVAASEA
jgi:hypothetical protein